MPTIVLCDTDAEFIDHLGAVLAERGVVEMRHAAAPSEAQTVAQEASAAVVVFGPGIHADIVLSTSERLAALSPSVGTVMVTPTVTTALMRDAMRAGLRDVIASAEVTYGDLAEAVEEAAVAAEQGRPAETSSAEQPVAPGDLGQVITVFGTKGGVGKSVIASNLGVALAHSAEQKVILIDLDLQFGDAAVMLKLEPKRTIADAVQAFDSLDSEMFEGFLTPHDSGLRVLLAPTSPEDAESITVARINKLIGLAREIADLVIVDTAGQFDETVLAAIDKSDTVLAVATMDIPSIKNTKVSIQKLRQLGYRNGMVKLVLNRADSKVYLETGDVEKTIGNPIVARIPSDRLVPRSVNKGVPVVLDAPKSAVTKSINGLAQDLTGSE